METRAGCPLRVRVNWMLKILIGPFRFVLERTNARSFLRLTNGFGENCHTLVYKCVRTLVQRVASDRFGKKVIKTFERCCTTYVRYCEKEEFYQLISVHLCLRKMFSRQFWSIISFVVCVRLYESPRECPRTKLLKQLFDVYCKILFPK